MSMLKLDQKGVALKTHKILLKVLGQWSDLKHALKQIF
jgi:hypothetical protein